MQFVPLILGGISAIGAISAGKQQADMYNAQAQIASNKAKATSAAYGEREAQMRREARLQAGERRAAMSQSGVGLSGSNADVDRQSEILAELDALNIRYEGETGRTDMLNESAINKASAKNARTQSYFNAAGSILSGTSSYYGGTMGGKKANTWG